MALHKKCNIYLQEIKKFQKNNDVFKYYDR